MGADDIIITCRTCGSRNRIPKARLHEKPLCGKCHARLTLQGINEPVAATDITFTAEVLQSGTPVLVDFWAPWCGPCRTMSPVLDSLSANYAGRLKVVKVNVDENPVTASKYGIRSIPSMFLFKNGTVVNTLQGALPQQELERQINRFIP
ncbi:MAG TPA: thioredoxin TrxC [Deltaproteobacteria bacterium]|nr:thioredoxin TrxC [Deltaproteobacteria bacterium]HPR54985.1 thioredoxin TrxC [Deltaproteobacteria bacterium]HXK46323.1 thioredoxin TrxC [Deltaproteobacteria bacterium]